MKCNQCEQTAANDSCTNIGVCGKTDNVSHLQDVLIYALRRLAHAALSARAKGIIVPEIDFFTVQALFITLTNVNFDPNVIERFIEQAIINRKTFAQLRGCKIDNSTRPIEEVKSMMSMPTGIDDFHKDKNNCSAMQMLLYGLKGTSAYAYHAAVLGKDDPNLYEFIYEGLAAGFPDREGNIDKERTLSDWMDLVLRCGKSNLRAMELLESGNVESFGVPTSTKVSLGQKKGKAILVSGHDLKDLYDLLCQTEGTGINIYTHGEMLPAHGYPKLHAFTHLIGHYGTAWQNQHKEISLFPGPVLFTTNCIQNPKEYIENVFTSGVTGWPGVQHCKDGDYSKLIERAKELPGFSEDVPGKELLTGFGKQSLLDAAPVILDSIKSGVLQHIFLVGGCDGAKPGRNYYSEFVEKAPDNTVVLTLGCGKFRFFDKDLGMIGSLPRLIDMGQCNDAYAALQVVTALAEILDCGVNDLPVSLVLSWYEQKAVSILLTLLAAGVKGIRLGPSLPSFVSEDILQLLVKEWGIAPITTPDKDIALLMQ